MVLEETVMMGRGILLESEFSVQKPAITCHIVRESATEHTIIVGTNLYYE